MIEQEGIFLRRVGESEWGKTTWFKERQGMRGNDKFPRKNLEE